MNEIKWAVQASGGGSTFDAMVRADVPGVKLDLLIASRDGIGAIDKARNLGLAEEQIVVIDPNQYKGEDGEVDMDGYGRDVVMSLKKRGIELVTQNGLNRKTPERVIEEFDGAIFNQHPQDPRYFGGRGMYGLRPHAARLYYANLTGERSEKVPQAMPVVQRVDKEYDQGSIVLYEAIDIPVEVTSEDVAHGGAGALQKLVLPVEHRVNIEFLRRYRSGTLHDLDVPPLPNPRGRAGAADEYASLARAQAITLIVNP